MITDAQILQVWSRAPDLPYVGGALSFGRQVEAIATQEQAKRIEELESLVAKSQNLTLDYAYLIKCANEKLKVHHQQVEQSHAQVRDAALEEAAKVCDRQANRARELRGNDKILISCAEAIRLRKTMKVVRQSQPAQPSDAGCKGMNCTALNNNNHSTECLIEHDSAVFSGAGNRNPEARYRGYANEPLWVGANDDETAAWHEGIKAREPKSQRFPSDALETALYDAWNRMDRARLILTDGTPAAHENWGVLDTSLDRLALKAKTATQPSDALDAKDAEMLNWLGENMAGASNSERYLPFQIYWGKGQNKNIREVIGEAMVKGKK